MKGLKNSNRLLKNLVTFRSCYILLKMLIDDGYYDGAITKLNGHNPSRPFTLWQLKYLHGRYTCAPFGFGTGSRPSIDEHMFETVLFPFKFSYYMYRYR